ncbi:MAG: hypothetical protein K2L41_00065, partial [Muribaculaceae bacterium]|nr:hypothetical protein [Muribaculaceae bacterium]
MRYILIQSLLLTLAPAAIDKSSITATLDSAYVTMGNITSLTVEVVEPRDASASVGFIPQTMPAQVEVVGEASCDTVNLNDEIRQITRRIILQSFDSGAYALPPVLYLNDGDTMLSNIVTLKVNPVDVSHLEDIHPDADTLSVKSRWYDFLPDWIIDYWGWILLTLLIVGGGVCAVLIFTRRVRGAFGRVRGPSPPCEMARQRGAGLGA